MESSARLYRDHKGDYKAVAAKLCLDGRGLKGLCTPCPRGDRLYVNHEGMDSKPPPGPQGARYRFDYSDK